LNESIIGNTEYPPDLPYKRKYHRLYKKKELNNEDKQEYYENLAKNKNLITQENLRNLQVKKSNSNSRKNIKSNEKE